jgi:RNA polymerase sigma factor (sigma-70 family)
LFLKSMQDPLGSIAATIVERIRQGDRAAEEELVKRYRRPVYLMARVRLRNREAADDVAQEAMLAVLQALRGGQIREPSQLSAFVYGVVRNLLNSYYRKESWKRTVPLPDDPDDLITATTNREAEENGAKLQAIRQLVDRMEPTDRRILQLILVEGMNPGEIAMRLGVSGDVVRARKSRAVKRILAAMQGGVSEI